MIRLLSLLFGRLPIGWLQLTHNRGRLFAAIAGVAFANLLVFFQLGFLGALSTSVVLPYESIRADILISAPDARTLTDGKTVPRVRLYEALGVDGVKSGSPLYVGSIRTVLPGQGAKALTVFGIDPSSANAFWPDSVAKHAHLLTVKDLALLDQGTRMIRPEFFEAIESQTGVMIETNGVTLTLRGLFSIGAGFEADGYLIVSDQTFLQLFPEQSAGTPRHILLKAGEGEDLESLSSDLLDHLGTADVLVRPMAQAGADEQFFQTVERPVGTIFGFGAIMGIIVGLVIVYQVLSTDVADHIQEYATLKAVGYEQGFFNSIVFEQALILAIAGFIPGSIISSLIYEALGGTTGLPLDMSVERLLSVFIGTLIACSLSGALATRRLKAADPADLF